MKAQKVRLREDDAPALDGKLTGWRYEDSRSCDEHQSSDDKEPLKCRKFRGAVKSQHEDRHSP